MRLDCIGSKSGEFKLESWKCCAKTKNNEGQMKE